MMMDTHFKKNLPLVVMHPNLFNGTINKMFDLTSNTIQIPMGYSNFL